VQRCKDLPKDKYNEERASCNSQYLFGNPLKVTDVYTNEAYPYASDQQNINSNTNSSIRFSTETFRLSYEIRFYDDISSYDEGRYVEGTNTLTPDHLSVEGDAQKLEEDVPDTAAKRDAKVKSDLAQYRVALMLYGDDYDGKYPANVTSGVADNLTTDVFIGNMAGYIPSPLASPNSKPYMYLAGSDEETYLIYGWLEGTSTYYWINSEGRLGESATVPTASLLPSSNTNGNSNTNSSTNTNANQNTNVNASGDIDLDGLTNAEESQYRTNPENPDSDGDGYLDGDEVENGYNPMGSGRLSGY
jgi:hypothetical protein